MPHSDVCPSVKEALDLLNHLVLNRLQTKKRLTKLLKNPEAETAEGWYMYLPACFNDELDRSKLIRRGDHTMSQGEFVRFLVSGPSDDNLKRKIGEHQSN